MTTAQQVQGDNNSDLFSALHLEDLSAEEQANFLESIGEVVHERVLLRVMENISSEEERELERIIGQEPDNPQAVIDYVVSVTPQFESLVAEEIASYRQELLERMGESSA